ncbi:MAG: hypothetical protein WCG66_12365 [bacterium]
MKVRSETSQKFSSPQRYLQQVLSICAIALASALPHARAQVLFEGTPKPGAFVINFATATHEELAVDTTDFEEKWRTFLVSSPNEIIFEPGKRYKIGYNYEVTKLKSDETKFYHFLDVPGDDSSRRAHAIWPAKAGESGRQEFIATLPDSDGYRLSIGIVNGGAITIKNLKIEEVPPPKLDEGFLYQGAMENDGRLKFSSQAKIMDGGLVVSTTSKQWNNYFTTSPQELPLLPGHTYRISYLYSVENTGEEARMNQSLSADGKAEKFHWQSWEIAPGQSNVKEVQLEITEPGCSFAIGDFGGSTVRIEDFTIEDLGGQ